MTVNVDYLIVGAGASGLAFADRILTNSDATMAIVDRRAQVGGHWADSYPFVRLHAPTRYYGVDSMPFGNDRLDDHGWNEGLEHCARGAEITALYEQLMNERLLPSGRVQFFPMHEVTNDGAIRSLINGREQEVDARRKVNAGYKANRTPKTHPPLFDVAQSVSMVAPHELPAQATGYDRFVVIGAGKTGMDAVTFLLAQGADPEQIDWVVPRDPYVINRKMVQTDPRFFKQVMTSMVEQSRAMAEANSVTEFEDMMEAAGNWLRLDPTIRPQMFHAACCSEKERDALASVNIIRMGKVQSIEPDAMILDGGTVPMTPSTLVVHATASALSREIGTTPVFSDDEITIQMLRYPAPCLSAAITAEIEQKVIGEDKNQYADPTGVKDVSADYLRTTFTGQKNQMMWNRHPDLKAFLRQSRLDAFGPVMRAGDRSNPEHQALFQALSYAAMQAAANIPKLLAA
ncbi:MAG: NAD(P)-binding protein [Parvularculaceae bacterium]|nr:NAD(P)-binding protein [Parvularculaceae bacterium]